MEEQSSIELNLGACNAYCIPEEVTPVDGRLHAADPPRFAAPETDFNYCPKYGVTNALLTGYQLMN